MTKGATLLSPQWEAWPRYGRGRRSKAEKVDVPAPRSCAFLCLSVIGPYAPPGIRAPRAHSRSRRKRPGSAGDVLGVGIDVGSRRAAEQVHDISPKRLDPHD